MCWMGGKGPAGNGRYPIDVTLTQAIRGGALQTKEAGPKPRQFVTPFFGRKGSGVARAPDPPPRLGSLVGHAGMILAIWDAFQRIMPAEVEIFIAGVADGPLAGALGQRLDGQPLGNRHHDIAAR